MITVDDVPKRPPIEPVEVKDLDFEEWALLQKLDAELEGVALNMVGDMFAVTFDLAQYPEHILAGLKKQWEPGGWIVGPLQAGPGKLQLAFVKPRLMGSVKVVANALESRQEKPTEPQLHFRGELAIKSHTPNTSTPLLVRMPTRGRPEQAIRVLERYRSMAESHVKIEVVMDADDSTMNCGPVLQRLCDLDCVITIGHHKSKIEAVNGGRVDDWAILVLASDDMWPVVEGYDQRIIADMHKHFPLLDGALNYDDGYNKSHRRDGKPVLNTLPIMGRHLWEQFGYVYEPKYKSLYSDDEFTEVMTRMKRMVFIDEDVLIEHRHPAAGKVALDVIYKHNDRLAPADRKLFEERQARGFDVPEVLLSILICTVPERADMLRRLVDWLRWQMRQYPRQVEICVDDRVGVSVGEKRQTLLERAIGKYIAFVDDDDWVASDYVSRILAAYVKYEYAYRIERPGGPDCVSLVGEMTTDGGSSERFEHSLKYSKWETIDGVHQRSPNHLNMVKRELALKVGFTAKNVGEDHDYSMRLRPLLETEVSSGEAPLYFYLFRPQQSIQRRSK